MACNSNANPATAADVDIKLATRLFGSVFRVKKWVGLSTGGTSNRDLDFIIPFPDKHGLPGKTDIKVTATASGKDMDVSSGFTIEEVDA